jgi:hypothetical protein
MLRSGVGVNMDIPVKTGAATCYSAANPDCRPITYPTDFTFIQPANVHLNVHNYGSTDSHLLNTSLIPE